MISTQASQAMIVISAAPGAFEISMAEGGVASESIILARCMGVHHLLVVINRMDDISFDQSRYTALREVVLVFAKRAGFALRHVIVVPACSSGHSPENITNRTESLSWYKGPTIVAALESLAADSESHRDDAAAVSAEHDPLRAIVFQVEKIGGIGFCLMSRLVSGHLPVDAAVEFRSPSGLNQQVGRVQSRVRSMEWYHTARQEAHRGQCVSINIVDWNPAATWLLHPGIVLTDTTSPLNPVRIFAADMIVLHSRGKGLKCGAEVQLFCHCARSLCKIVDFTWVKTIAGEFVAAHPERVIRGHVVRVVLAVQKPIVMEAGNPSLSRFVLHDAGRTLAKRLMLHVRMLLMQALFSLEAIGNCRYLGEEASNATVVGPNARSGEMASAWDIGRTAGRNIPVRCSAAYFEADRTSLFVGVVSAECVEACTTPSVEDVMTSWVGPW
jgi:translation elongation factor EF-1alpha